MEPTGYDTILFVFADLERVMQNILGSIRDIYTRAEFDLEHVRPDQDGIADANVEQCIAALSSEHIIIYMYVAPHLRGYLEEHGYTLSPEGEGPFAMHVRRRYEIVFHMKGINECHDNSEPIKPPLPYNGWLCSPVVYEITIVTPGEPDQHHASKHLIELIINECISTGSRRSGRRTRS
jgi:hypothetical protein